jgi:hypothetical protein
MLRLTLAVLSCVVVQALDNGLGLTPALAYSTWNRFFNDINETLVQQLADALVSTGLRDAGVEYINIDAGMWVKDRDAEGNLQCNPATFPSGVASLADYVHVRGLKLGVYTDLATGSCGTGPGSGGHYATDAAHFAALGVDYLKVDYCGTGIPEGGDQELAAWGAFADALNATGRPIYLSICPKSDLPKGTTGPLAPYAGETGLYFPPSNWTREQKRAVSNSWLVEVRNNVDGWGPSSAHCIDVGHPCGMITNIDSQVALGRWEETGPGGLVDADMLEICQFNGTANRPGLTTSEGRLHYFTWAVLPSPLILSFDARTIQSVPGGQACLDMVKNPEVLAINQDSAVIGARLLQQQSIKPPYGANSSEEVAFQVFGRTLANGDRAALLINRSPAPSLMHVSWAELGLPQPNSAASVRDVGGRTDLGSFPQGFSATVQSHDALFLRVSQAAQTAPPVALLQTAAAQYDVIVYGATPCGIAAAIAASREGRTVLLLHPLARIGGMMTGGLGHTDVGNRSVIGGLALDVFKAIGAKYGSTAPVFDFEPHVSLDVFRELLAAEGGKVTLLVSTTVVGAQKNGASVSSITVVPSAVAQSDMASAIAQSDTYSGSVFVDATYEGDLLALAGISFAFGREGNTTYGETLAGRLAVPNNVSGHQFSVPLDYRNATTGALLPLITGSEPGAEGEGDAKVQAYNFRSCLTKVVSNRVPIPKPSQYDPGTWELLRRYLAVVGDRKGFDLGSLMNVSPLPNGKTDVNNNGCISTDAIGLSWEWPTASPARRVQLYSDHLQYQASFFYFLTSDSSVPAKIRADMQSYGYCADEFSDSGFWPPQLYVREGRRMVSDFVFTQKDRETDRTKPDSIGLFSYNIDTHNAQRFPQGTYVRNEGDVEVDAALGPGQMPFRMIVPRAAEAKNVLAPVPASASHIGYGTIRLEPQFLILGQSAGVAAAQFLSSGVSSVQEVDVDTLQARLRVLNQIIDL